MKLVLDIFWVVKGQRRQNEDRFIVDMIGQYPTYAVLDGHGGFECAEIYSNSLIAVMQDHLSDNLLNTETRNSPLFWEELFNKGVSDCDKMIKGLSGKDFHNSYDIIHKI